MITFTAMTKKQDVIASLFFGTYLVGCSAEWDFDYSNCRQPLITSLTADPNPVQEGSLATLSAEIITPCPLTEVTATFPEYASVDAVLFMYQDANLYITEPFETSSFSLAASPYVRYTVSVQDTAPNTNGNTVDDALTDYFVLAASDAGG